MDLQLLGKVALITGGSRGLGFAAASALVTEGCHVAICARNEERLQQAANELCAIATRGTEVLAVAADVATSAGVNRAVAKTVEKFGRHDGKTVIRWV